MHPLGNRIKGSAKLLWPSRFVLPAAVSEALLHPASKILDGNSEKKNNKKLWNNKPVSTHRG